MKPSAKLAPVLDALYRRLREVERAALAKHLPRGVTLGDVRVLRAVERVGISGVSAVATYLGTSQPAATVAVARLEGRGLVVQSQNATDGRRKALNLTAKGKQIEVSHALADADAAEAIVTSVPKNDRIAIADLLVKLATGEGAGT